MPIYAYACESCGHQQDVLQKMSDPLLTTCPSCGKPSFVKQVTAAGFQLKGSGWYQTDFRNNGSAPAKKADDAAAPAASPAAAPVAATATPAAPAASPAPSPSAPSP